MTEDMPVPSLSRWRACRRRTLGPSPRPDRLRLTLPFGGGPPRKVALRKGLAGEAGRGASRTPPQLVVTSAAPALMKDAEPARRQTGRETRRRRPSRSTPRPERGGRWTLTGRRHVRAPRCRLGQRPTTRGRSPNL